MWVHVLILISGSILRVSSKIFVDNGNFSMTDNILLDINNNTGTADVVYGSEGIITCDIRSKAPININWYYTNGTTGKINRIIESDKYLISTNGKELRIKKMDFDMVGNYICMAAYSQKVRVVTKAPKITGKIESRATRGSNANIECKILEGLPKPTISWEYMGQTGLNYTSIPGSGNMLRLSNVADKNAGRYKCVAENIAGKDEHVARLIIESPPRIMSNSSLLFSVYEGFEGHKLSLPCKAIGIPQPTITWKINGTLITSNEKYLLKDDALVIMDLIEKDSTSYTCEAKNYIGSDQATFITIVFTFPKITGITEIRAIKGSHAVIECKIVKGFPNPNITWEYLDQPGINLTSIPGSGNMLRLSSLAEKNAGRYKCVAENIAGKDEHVTTLVVEFPPRILSKSSTIYEGLEGDIALRIPCEVVGVPRPSTTWKINGTLIKSNKKYSIEDGALVIMDPIKKDSLSYTCEVKNYLGIDNVTLTARVDNYIKNLGKSRYIYLLKGKTSKLDCEGYNSTSQSVRWFIEDLEVHRGKPYLVVEEASYFDDGNYTCRVSDKHGHTQTHKYVVDVGYPPKLLQSISLNDWRGDTTEILSNCGSSAKPQAHVEWKFNGKVLTDRDLAEVGLSFKWGNYVCNVTNVHGSVQRSFDVKSSACLINRKLENIQNMPLLLTDDLTWPQWYITKHYLLVEQGDMITLSCPFYQEAQYNNTFQKFPIQRELKASCQKQDIFLVNNKSYKLTDLLCNNNIEPSIVREKTKCLTETSEFIKVGYNVAGFLETYEVCYDHARNMPLYIRALMTETHGTLSAAHNWYTYPGIGDRNINRGFTCKHSNSTCCYSKTQLLNPRDFKYGSAIKSTYLDFLNAVPYWRPCENMQTTWEDIDEMVRSQLVNYGEFVAWSGTHTFQEKHGVVIPRYLWKVVKFDEYESIVIVHVNDPTPTDQDIKCKDVSSTDDVNNWFTSSNNYTYCCTLPDFLVAFVFAHTYIAILIFQPTNHKLFLPLNEELWDDEEILHLISW